MVIILNLLLFLVLVTYPYMKTLRQLNTKKVSKEPLLAISKLLFGFAKSTGAFLWVPFLAFPFTKPLFLFIRWMPLHLWSFYHSLSLQIQSSFFRTLLSSIKLIQGLLRLVLLASLILIIVFHPLVFWSFIALRSFASIALHLPFSFIQCFLKLAITSL